MNNFRYNLWNDHAILRDISSKRSSSHCSQGHNLHHRGTGFWHSFRYVFFSLGHISLTCFNFCCLFDPSFLKPNCYSLSSFFVLTRVVNSCIQFKWSTWMLVEVQKKSAMLLSKHWCAFRGQCASIVRTTVFG